MTKRKTLLNFDRDQQCAEVLSLYALEFAPMLEPLTVSWRRVEKLPPIETEVAIGEPVGVPV